MPARRRPRAPGRPGSGRPSSRPPARPARPGPWRAGAADAPAAGPDQDPDTQRRPTSAEVGVAPRRRGPVSDVHDRAGERPGDSGDVLHPGDHELAQLVDVAGLRAHDHVVRPGHVLGQRHALDVGDLGGHLRGLADVGLDQDVGLHHHAALLSGRSALLPGVSLRPVGSTYRAAGPAGTRPDPWRLDDRMTVPPDATLADLGEFGLIEALAQVFPAAEQVLLGPGDDAAVVAVPDGRVVVSTDLHVDSRHFRRDWASALDIGHRVAAANLSDLNAMGGRATALTVGLAAPADLSADWALDLARGIAEECALVGASVVGGDLTAADQVVIAVTALGQVTGRPVLRSGA